MDLDISKLADGTRHEVAGLIASQAPDRDGEVFDYEGSKKYFQAWSDNVRDATSKTAAPGEESLGNVRLMHGRQTVGKLVKIIFDDVKKCIYGVAQITDEGVWNDIQKGIYSAFSVAGKLVSSFWKAGKKWITVDPVETSIVDYPSNPDTTFQWARGAGVSLCVAKFSGETALEPVAVPEQGYVTPPVVKVSPPGWGDTVEAMKEHPEIDNPWALAWWMEDEGYEPHKVGKAALVEFWGAFQELTSSRRKFYYEVSLRRD